jgi:hypothetical protein
MADDFDNIRPNLESPGEGLLSVTPDDDTDLGTVSRALYIGGTSDLAVRMKDGSEGTLLNVPAGAFLPLRVVRVMETGTTATGIVAVF